MTTLFLFGNMEKNQQTLISFLTQYLVSVTTVRKVYRICSDNKKFDQRCHKLEKWLMERGYSETMVRTQMLKARGESGIAFLNEGIPKLLIVNSLLTLLTIQRFKMSEAYWRNLKFC